MQCSSLEWGYNVAQQHKSEIYYNHFFSIKSVSTDVFFALPNHKSPPDALKSYAIQLGERLLEMYLQLLQFKGRGQSFLMDCFFEAMLCRR